jgi:hypothetical protein
LARCSQSAAVVTARPPQLPLHCLPAPLIPLNCILLLLLCPPAPPSPRLQPTLPCVQSGVGRLARPPLRHCCKRRQRRVWRREHRAAAAEWPQRQRQRPQRQPVPANGRRWSQRGDGKRRRRRPGAAHCQPAVAQCGGGVAGGRYAVRGLGLGGSNAGLPACLGTAPCPPLPTHAHTYTYSAHLPLPMTHRCAALPCPALHTLHCPAGGARRFTQRQVEEVKLVLRLLPIFGATVLYWTIYMQASTGPSWEGGGLRQRLCRRAGPAASAAAGAAPFPPAMLPVSCLIPT